MMKTSSQDRETEGIVGLVVVSGRIVGLFVVDPEERRLFLPRLEGESFGDSLGGKGRAARITDCGVSWRANHSRLFSIA